MNINKKILGLSTVVSLLTIYIVPGRVLDEFEIGFGYPIEFFTLYSRALNSRPHLLHSTNLNIINLALNILIIYLVVHVLVKIKNKLSSQ